MTDTPRVVLPPMPKPDEFGIDWRHAPSAEDPGNPYGKVHAARVKAYREALAAWERACAALAGR
jgi:hypothetical protein